MEKTIFFLTLQVLIALAANAMDEPNQNAAPLYPKYHDDDNDIDNGHGVQVCNDVHLPSSDPATQYKGQIVDAISIYQANLLRALGADVCAFFMSVFNNDKYRHIIMRLAQLQRFCAKFSASIRIDDISAQVSQLTLEVNTAKSYSGRVFLLTCRDILTKIARHYADDEIKDQDLCVICSDNLRCMAILNCRHLTICAACYLQYRDESLDECPMCRARIVDYTTISKCALCNDLATMLAKSCGHSAYCNTCLGNRLHDACPECQLPSTGFLEIYH